MCEGNLMKNKRILIFGIVIAAIVTLLAGGIWLGLKGKATSIGENQPAASPEPSHDPPKQEFPVIVISLESQSDSGQSGTARLEGMVGNKTKVILKLFGGSFGQQPAHIHTGSCPNPGAIKYALSKVESGMSETVINVNLEALVKSGSLAINVHKSEEEAQVYTACGNLPKPL